MDAKEHRCLRTKGALGQRYLRAKMPEHISALGHTKVSRDIGCFGQVLKCFWT